MGQSSNRIWTCSLVALAAILLTACPQQSPEARVIEARGKYVLRPTGLLIQEIEEAAEGDEAPPAETIEATEAAAAAVASEEEAEEGIPEEEEMAPEGPRTVEVIFDLLVRFNATSDALPGITIDIMHKDPFQEEKGRHLKWIETPSLRKGEERQVSAKLEVDNYEDGDEFSIELSAYVPPERRGEYREFSEAAP